jgi:hypothetical protein
MMPDRLPQTARHNRPVSNGLHPYVYAGMAGFVLLFVVSAWVFFGGGEYMPLLLAVVTGFFLMAAGIPFLIWLTWRGRHADGKEADTIRFRDWIAGDFEAGPERRNAADAAVEALLPIAAVAIGMVAIGIVFYITAAESAAA